jgi:hypothetical protein
MRGVRGVSVSRARIGTGAVQYGPILGGAALVGALASTRPELVSAIVLGPFVTVLLLIAIDRRIRRHPDAEFLLPIARWGMLARLVMVFAQLAIGLWLYGGQIDFVGYQGMAVKLLEDVWQGAALGFTDAAWIREQFVTFATFLIVATLALSAVVVGPNILALFLLTVPLSVTAAYLYFRSFESVAPAARERRFVALMLFLFPSITFWSIFLGKDVWVFFGMATVAFCLSRLLQKVRMGAILGLVVGLAVVFATRPHVALPLAAAASVALMTRRLSWRGPEAYLRPIVRVSVLVVAVGLVAVVGGRAVLAIGVQAMTVEALTERALRAHAGFASTEAGSALPRALDGTDLHSIARFIPLGVMTLLFRPFLWEAHNVVAAIAAVENLFLLALVVFRWRSLLAGMTRAGREPFMLFVVLAFVGTAVALSFNWNLGTTARHRTMVLPYLVMLLAPLPGRTPVRQP